ncbi:YbjN domain-containing protein [Sphingomicrobium astaxanthinifaciens]|uniref:YbjN domain-containing protein n=1 Tax=Sphingomicrobium astaxanthinifaciens TaxID=1227949 RepID=UPI0038998EC0
MMAEDRQITPREEDAPVEIFEAYFNARGWACERVGEGEAIASASGSWSQYELRAVWRADDSVLQFLAFPDIKVVTDKKAAIYETIGLINEQLWMGHFEYWQGPGVIAFRHAILVDNSGQLSLEEAEGVSEAALEECERFFPVFQFVLWGGKSPSEAIEAALIDTAGEA